MAPPLSKLAVIGLGEMGSRMAKRLVRAGFVVRVHDVQPAPVQHMVQVGAVAAADAADAATGADAVLTMLRSTEQVRSAYEAVLRAAKRGALCIDCSTVDPATATALSEAAAARGLRFLDAPVSGGIGGADAGTLVFMVGGERAAMHAAKPVLDAMGAASVHCGGAGAGQAAKLCNNMVLGVSMAAVSEAMNLGVKLGLEPRVLADIINSSSGRCWASDSYNPVPGVMPGAPSSHRYQPGFTSALMAKDLALAMQAAQQHRAAAPLAAGALALYEALCDGGAAQKDFSYVYEYLRSRA